MNSATIYGHVSEEHLQWYSSNPPDSWRLGPQEWPKWLAGTVSLLEKSLWPQSSLLNSPGYPTQRLRQLTSVDFDVLANLRSQGADSLRSEPVGTNRATLYGCFQRENTWDPYFFDAYSEPPLAAGLMASYMYAVPNGIFGPTLPPPEMRAVQNAVIGEPVNRCIGSLTLTLKMLFQRPRPFQLAAEFGRREFFHWMSSSANTPALPAGHEMEAVFVFLVVANAKSLDLASPHTAAFAKWCAGTGDRRVYAGLHYPSDSLASLLVAARLFPYVFDAVLQPSLILAFELYLEHSAVFQRIRDHVRAATTTKPSPYQVAYDALMHELS